MTKNQRRRKIPLTLKRLKEALSYDPVTGLFTWRIQCAHRNTVGDVAGSSQGNGYISIGIDNNTTLAHRLAWFYVKGKWPPGLIDHRDLCRSNNKWSNLRPATHGQNNRNRPARRHSSTGLKGVTFVKRSGKYHARIMHNKRLEILGDFGSAIMAAEAYRLAAERLHGQFART